jgi:hypothetical protein
VNASPPGSATPARETAEGIPQTGEEDPLAEVSTDEAFAETVADSRREGATGDDASDGSDSIEPSRIPGSAEDIHVAGETGPGPSG